MSAPTADFCCAKLVSRAEPSRPLPGSGREGFYGSMTKPGINDYTERLGKFAMVESGLQRSRLGRFPVPCGFEAEELIYADTMARFLDGAEAFVARVEEWLDVQLSRPWGREDSPRE